MDGVLSLMDVLKKHLPAVGPAVLDQLEADIKDLYFDRAGFNIQWRTKVYAVEDPEDKDLPPEKRRLLFKFMAVAGDFSPDVKIKTFNITYEKGGNGK